MSGDAADPEPHPIAPSLAARLAAIERRRDPAMSTAEAETSFDLASAVTGRTYRIWVARPLVPAPPSGYPVLYLIDGNGTFRQSADQMRARQFVDVAPAAVVGIGYPTDNLWDWVALRTHDLTPSPPNRAFLPVFASWAAAGGYGVADAGGAASFHSFIETELKPELERRLPVDASEQALFGHSLGGLFALHVLFAAPQAYRHFAISSPSILYNAREILAGEAAFAGRVTGGGVGPRVLLMAGSEENWPSSHQLAAMPDDEALRWARFGRTVDNVVELADRLGDLAGPPGYRVERQIFDGENHMSVVPASLSRTLSFAFGLAGRRAPDD